jgi:hypothetical protein
MKNVTGSEWLTGILLGLAGFAAIWLIVVFYALVTWQ